MEKQWIKYTKNIRRNSLSKRFRLYLVFFVKSSYIIKYYYGFFKFYYEKLWFLNEFRFLHVGIINNIIKFVWLS